MESISDLRLICQPRPKHLRSWSAKIIRSYSIYITYIFLRLKIGPNLTSFVGFCCNIAAAVFLFTSSWVLNMLSPLFIVLYFTFDFVDGEIARYTNKASITGLFIDRLAGLFAEPFFWCALSYRFISQNILSHGFNSTIMIIGILCVTLPLFSRLILEPYYGTIIDALQESANLLSVNVSKVKRQEDTKSRIVGSDSISEETTTNFVKALGWFFIVGFGKVLLLLVVLIFDFLRDQTALFGSLIDSLNISMIGLGTYIVIYSLAHTGFAIVLAFTAIKNRNIEKTISSL